MNDVSRCQCGLVVRFSSNDCHACRDEFHPRFDQLLLIQPFILLPSPDNFYPGKFTASLLKAFL